MKIYTKAGDSGLTSLMNDVRVPKSDDRIELLGTIDELSAAIGLAKVQMEETQKEQLSLVQQELMQIMAGIAQPDNGAYNVPQEMISRLEEKIDDMEQAFPREKQFVLYGDCENSARLDFARAVARRAERCFQKVSSQYSTDANAAKYMNRLSDYLYTMARCQLQ